MSDIMIDASIKFQNYLIKIVGGDAFYSYYNLYNYFKNLKKCKKYKNNPIVKKSTSQVDNITLDTWY